MRRIIIFIIGLFISLTGNSQEIEFKKILNDRTITKTKEIRITQPWQLETVYRLYCELQCVRKNDLVDSLRTYRLIMSVYSSKNDLSIPDEAKIRISTCEGKTFVLDSQKNNAELVLYDRDGSLYFVKQFSGSSNKYVYHVMYDLPVEVLDEFITHGIASYSMQTSASNFENTMNEEKSRLLMEYFRKAKENIEESFDPRKTF